MKNICLINGSLRKEKAASLEFIRDMVSRLPDSEYSKKIITLKARMKDSYSDDILKTMADADALVFVFPLHNYGLPGALMCLLEDYYRYKRIEGNIVTPASVYMIVNCAFPRAEKVCGEAIRVMRNFCCRLTLNWRFALCIGTGPVVVMTRKIPFLYPRLKRAYKLMVADISGISKEKPDDYFIRPVIPESIIAAIRRHYEKSGHMIEYKHT
ncbi:MAG: NAD(P)H-dependent oxidoreductase [Dehalococcoidales bacterium]|nr:NAD(P)H-dependent oxidoreductase [Dehalococcoidales bacterium]